MSVPIVASAMADAMMPLIVELERSLECHASISRIHVDGTRYVWVAVVHDHGRAFQGIADTASRALMVANSERQTFGEKTAKDMLEQLAESAA